MSDVLQIIHGDALSSLRTLESESAQTCVTSPPYFGLRSYGTEPLVWDNHNGCEHVWNENAAKKMRWGTSEGASDKQKSNAGTIEPMDGLSQGDACRCGAWRGELGLEPTPELYAKHLVEIFREARRVLRSDGTLWLNLGDSYAGGGRGGNPEDSPFRKQATNRGSLVAPSPMCSGLKPKDLVGIPWMVAFALRADGWHLRSDIIWSKPNPMPESVTDRPTRSHEYLFLLSKSRTYYYDAKAISEPLTRPEELDRATPAKFGGALKYIEAQKQSRLHSGNEYKRKPSNRDNFRRENSKRGQPQFGQTVGTHRPDRKDTFPTETRNKRSVWSIATTPYPDAHFATFPTEIPRLCVLAGTKAGDVVLDPFAGSGTTGKVAIELGRKAILIEPKAEYIEMIKRRCQTTIGLPLTYEASA